MSAPMDGASYLLRSEHRVRALELLAERAHTPAELAEATDASRKTIRRALGTFTEYGWVRRDGRQYRITRPGELVADRTRDLIQATRTAATLAPVAGALPASLDVDLADLDDVRVTVPDGPDTAAPARRMVEVLRGADEIRVVAFAVVPGAVEATREGTHADIVLTPGALSFVADDPTTLDHLRAILDAGWDVRRLDEDLAYNLVVADSTVMFGLVDDAGGPSGLVETSDAAVQRWALDSFETYRDRAVPVEPADLAE